MGDTGISSQIVLAVGEQRTFPLSSLAMAGYQWSGSVGGDDPGAVTLLLRRAEPPSTTRPGLSAPEEGVVRGIRSGSAVVRLELRRSWEGDRPPAKFLELEVQVGGQVPAEGQSR